MVTGTMYNPPPRSRRQVGVHHADGGKSIKDSSIWQATYYVKGQLRRVGRCTNQNIGKAAL